jgi:broad specificity phosphatase PhoE
VKVYIVRHGRTLFNEKHLIQGRCDAPLTQEGLNQAKALNKGLENIHFDACFTSPLSRAMTTGKEIIKGKNIPFFTNDNLMEFNYGHLEGDSETKLMDLYPVFLGEKVEGFDGESLEDVKNRALKALEEIYHQYPQGNVLIVTHAGIITCLLKEISILDENQLFDVENGSVTILERNYGWKIIDVNNKEYLKQGGYTK